MYEVKYEIGFAENHFAMRTESFFYFWLEQKVMNQQQKCETTYIPGPK